MQTKLISLLIFVPSLLCCLFISEVRAELSPAPGDFGWRKSIPLHLIAEDAVVADLGLSLEVTEKLRDLQVLIHSEVLADIQMTISRSFPDELLRSVESHGPAYMERDVWPAACATHYRIRNTHRAEIADLLTTRQLARLDEIHLQTRERSEDALGDPNVAKELKLTDEQRARIRRIFESTRKLESPKSRFERREGYTARARNVLNVLTEEQRAAFTKLLGEPLKSEVKKSGNNPSPAKITNRSHDPNEEELLLTFDELLQAELAPRLANRDAVLRRGFAFDTYRTKYGLLIGTCEIVGTPAVGTAIRLSNPVAAFEVIGGAAQPYVSPHSILLAAGGKTRELLLTFEMPVTSVSIVSDRCPETPDVVRLLIVEPMEHETDLTAVKNGAYGQVQVRVLAVDEKRDDAIEAPGNTLSVDLQGKLFHHVLIECTTEQEGFDDLRFIRRKRTPSEEQAGVTSLFDWEMIAGVNGREKGRVRKPVGDAAAIETKEVTVSDLKLSVPEAWKRREPKSEMRLAEYEVPAVEGDKQTGEFVVSYNQDQEGDPKRNWKLMLRGFEKPSWIVSQGRARLGGYTLVDITGTYNNPVGLPDLDKSERLEEWRVVKVYLNSQNVRYVLKIDGPAKTVEAHLDGLRATFGGDAETEREWR